MAAGKSGVLLRTYIVNEDECLLLCTYPTIIYGGKHPVVSAGDYTTLVIYQINFLQPKIPTCHSYGLTDISFRLIKKGAVEYCTMFSSLGADSNILGMACSSPSTCHVDRLYTPHTYSPLH
jgi:hypothetical protein